MTNSGFRSIPTDAQFVGVKWDGAPLVLILGGRGQAVALATGPDETAQTGGWRIAVTKSNGNFVIDVPGFTADSGADGEHHSTLLDIPDGFPNPPGWPIDTVDGPTEQFFVNEILSREPDETDEFGTVTKGDYEHLVAATNIVQGIPGTLGGAASATQQADIFINVQLTRKDPNDSTSQGPHFAFRVRAGGAGNIEQGMFGSLVKMRFNVGTAKWVIDENLDDFAVEGASGVLFAEFDIIGGRIVNLVGP